jgi:hypothetical protein
MSVPADFCGEFSSIRLTALAKMRARHTLARDVRAKGMGVRRWLVVRCWSDLVEGTARRGC